MNSICGAPGNTAKCAAGMASAIRRTTGGGEDLSRSPAIQIAGTSIWGSRGSVLTSPMAYQAAAQPSGSSERSFVLARRAEWVREPTIQGRLEYVSHAVAARIVTALPGDGTCSPLSALQYRRRSR